MERDGSHDFGHLLRVLRNAEKISAGEERSGCAVDREVVGAAALMHDLVNLPKDHPERHLASGRSAERAVSFFESTGAFDAARLERIADAIRSHSYSAGLEPGCPEAQIVTDADRLEALGAFGLARCFQVSGLLDRQLVDMVDPWAERRPLDDMTYAVDHFFEKLLTLEERFYTDTGRRMAADRTQFIRDFIDQLRRELD
jgi:uncharacterized protein